MRTKVKSLDYEVEFEGNKISVGCQTITLEDLDKITQFVKEAKKVETYSREEAFELAKNNEGLAFVAIGEESYGGFIYLPEDVDANEEGFVYFNIDDGYTEELLNSFFNKNTRFYVAEDFYFEAKKPEPLNPVAVKKAVRKFLKSNPNILSNFLIKQLEINFNANYRQREYDELHKIIQGLGIKVISESL